MKILLFTYNSWSPIYFNINETIFLPSYLLNFFLKKPFFFWDTLYIRKYLSREKEIQRETRKRKSISNLRTDLKECPCVKFLPHWTWVSKQQHTPDIEWPSSCSRSFLLRTRQYTKWTDPRDLQNTRRFFFLKYTNVLSIIVCRYYVKYFLNSIS